MASTSDNSKEDAESMRDLHRPDIPDLLSDDALFEGLKRSPYTEGWPEDKWKEEFEKHPFFMTEAPDPSKELPPLIEGLQQLKYGDDENTPDELAKTYKDDGNFYFKCKKYRDAISHYTMGIKQNCCSELKAQLFNNRSAANYFLENFKSSLNDCEETLKLDSSYKKAKIRRAQCLFRLEKYEQCIETCDDICSDGPNTEMIDLKKDAILKKKLKDRNSRKNEIKERVEKSKEETILEAIESRNIKIQLAGNKKFKRLSDLEPECVASVKLERVDLKEDRLFWPVLYNFPELSLNMPINEFDEDATFEELLYIIWEGMTEHDPEGKFVPNNVRIFFLDKHTRPVEFQINRTLKSVTSDEKFVVSGGLLLFVLLLKGSDFTMEYLQRAENAF